MLKNQHFIRQIFLLVIVPITLALLFISCCVYAFQKQQSQVFEQQLFSVIESALVTPLEHNHTPPIDVIKAILKIDGVLHISIVDLTRPALVRDFGLPIKSDDLGWVTGHKARHRLGNTAFQAFELPNKNWLLAGTSNQTLVINEYKNFFLVVLCAILVLGIIAFFSTKLHQTITAPLRSLVTQTRHLLTQTSNTPVTLPAPNLYGELVNIINEFVDFQQSIRDEMRNLGEQSTVELRETLETVEIQNIELDIARKNALQVSKAKSQFLANTSHELRTPLNGILGFANLLLKTELSAQQLDYLSTIEQSAHGLLTVINDILDFSKLETGQLTLEYKPISLNEVIEDVLSLHAPQAHEKNIRLLSTVHRNVRQNLLGDPHRIRQVITNLVANAIKFSNRGNVVLHATSLGETDNQAEIKITITDNGIGLTPEQQERLFTAFSKADNSDSRLQGGAGLGLAIANGLVNKMGGEIGVESEPNRGSSFWFTLLLGIDNTSQLGPCLHNSLYGVHALIYDANDESRNEVTHHLAEWGIFYIEESNLADIEKPLSPPRDKPALDIVILDAYTDVNSFDKDKLLRIIHNINARHQIPVVVLAPKSIQRLLQEDILGLNTMVILRPLVRTQLYQSICNQLEITQPLTGPNDANPIANNNIKPSHVLVVEDNAANLKLVCAFLKGLGVEVTSCENGYEAIKLAAQSVFDLIFMDIQMPGIDGLETTRKIRAQESGVRTPIIALTAHAVDEQKTRLLLAGMDDYLSKPVSESDLRLMINRWSRQSESHQAEQPPVNALDAGAPQQRNKVSDNNEGSAAKVFDWNESMLLAKHLPDLAKDMLTMLVDSLEPTQQQMNVAIGNQDWQSLSDIVHKFHGGCCYCGVPDLRYASKKLETALNAKHEAQYPELIQNLYEQMQILTTWLEEYDLESLFI